MNSLSSALGAVKAYFRDMRRLTRTALIAALYVALCVALAPISYGPVQVRISEALTLLVVLCPEAIVGVTIGCFISNMASGMFVDMFVGTATTLVAALVSWKLRDIRWTRLSLPVLASLPPVLFNAVVVGIELTVLYMPGTGAAGYAFNMLSVGAGQVVSCCVLGLLLVWAIEKNPALRRVFKANSRLRG